MKSIKDITYRNIAIMLVKTMPVQDQEFFDKVEEYLHIIKGLDKNSKVALRSAYIFGSKVPRQERQDLFQDIALTILEARVEDERLAYAIARCDWQDWWKKYTIRQHYSLDSILNRQSDDNEGTESTLGELIVGEAEFERKMDGKLDAERIWNKLPDYIKPIIFNRLLGKSTNQTDRQTLKRWIHKSGYQLLLA